MGRRLALQALAGVYRRDVIASGPRFHSAARAGAAFRVRFTNVAAGLVTADGAPPKASCWPAPIASGTSPTPPSRATPSCCPSRDVPEPVAARYAWGNSPPATLMSQSDLPAAPFRTDDWSATRISAQAR